MNHIFSKEALEAASNPDELDHPLEVVRPKLWIPLTGIVVITLAGLCWSVFGRLPVYITGFGVLVNPGNIKLVQTQSPGLVQKVLVKPGEVVRSGDIIATLEQPSLEQSLRQASETLLEVTTINEQELSANQRQFEAQVKSIERQQDLVREGKILSAKVDDSLEKRNKVLLELSRQNLVSADSLLESESNLVASKSKLAGYDAQVQELELSLEQARQKHTQAAHALQNQIDEARRTFERMELQLENSRNIRAQADGVVMQVMVTEGSAIHFGSPVVSLAIDHQPQATKNLCFFTVKDGKRVKAGMRIQVTPATVKRERYGSIIGKVTAVSSFPISQETAVNKVGSRELAAALLGNGAMIEIEAELEKSDDPSSTSGYQWTSKDPPVAISQGTTTINRVRVDQRAPITYVLPLLRTWLTGQKDDISPEF